MSRRIIGKEITRDDMMQLREQGYSNSEIAEMLEVCHATVYNWIGKQPADVRKNRRVKTEVVATQIAPELLRSELVTASAKYLYKDLCYTVDFGTGIVEITKAGFSAFDISDLADVAVSSADLAAKLRERG